MVISNIYLSKLKTDIENVRKKVEIDLLFLCQFLRREVVSKSILFGTKEKVGKNSSKIHGQVVLARPITNPYILKLREQYFP